MIFFVKKLKIEELRFLVTAAGAVLAAVATAVAAGVVGAAVVAAAVAAVVRKRV